MRIIYQQNEIEELRPLSVTHDGEEEFFLPVTNDGESVWLLFEELDGSRYLWPCLVQGQTLVAPLRGNKSEREDQLILVLEN